MRKYAAIFVVITILLALVTTFLVVQFNEFANDKIAQFAIFNTILLTLVGIFFVVFHDKINIYLKNYRREKEI